MRKLDISKKSNIRCEHCKHYELYDKSKSKNSSPMGYCNIKNREFKYWQSCNRFIWKDKYIGINLDKNYNGIYLCRRCRRPLTDTDSIARGFGKECYDRYIKEIIRQKRRLF